MNSLLDKQCRHYSNAERALKQQEIEELLVHTPEWEICSAQTHLTRSYSFANYKQTIAFVNQVADIAEAHDHHPEMQVSYKQCVVRYNTHTIKGITEKDFICAAHIDAILD